MLYLRRWILLCFSERFHIGNVKQFSLLLCKIIQFSITVAGNTENIIIFRIIAKILMSQIIFLQILKLLFINSTTYFYIINYN